MSQATLLLLNIVASHSYTATILLSNVQHSLLNDARSNANMSSLLLGKQLSVHLHKSITKVEATVARKLNQSSSPKTGCFRFRVCFFGSFLNNQKRTII